MTIYSSHTKSNNFFMCDHLLLIIIILESFLIFFMKIKKLLCVLEVNYKCYRQKICEKYVMCDHNFTGSTMHLKHAK